MLLSVIIVSYNTSQLTLQAVQSTLENVQKSKLLRTSCEIIVVDNNSSDDTVLQLKEISHPISIKILENKKNKGFGAANNQAVGISQGEYILFLNSDTIVQNNALENLVKTFQHNPHDQTTANLSSYQKVTDNLGIVAATLLNQDGSLQPQGGDAPTLLSVASQMLFLDDIPVLGKLLPSTQHTGNNTRQKINATQLIQMGWVGGTAMMVSREVIDSIGLFDEAIFMYGEDVEYCLRAQNHLFDVAVTPSAQIIHLGSRSSNTQTAIVGEMKGLQYLWSKHKPAWQTPFLKSILLLACLARTLIYSTLGQRDTASIYKRLLSQL